MNLDDDLRAALDRGDDPPAGDGFDDVRARAGRLRRRHRARRTGLVAAAIAVVAGGVVAGTRGDGETVHVGDSVPTAPEPTMPDSTTTSSDGGSAPEPTTPGTDTVPATEPTPPDTAPTTQPSPPTTQVTADEAAAAAFIVAWRRGDAETMRQLADSPEEHDIVETALAFGNARSDGDCTSQSSGQYQCVVDVSSGGRTYILVGAPGARQGMVWWVGPYHPDS